MGGSWGFFVCSSLHPLSLEQTVNSVTSSGNEAKAMVIAMIGTAKALLV